MTKLYIDHDTCPVLDDVLRLASERAVTIELVTANPTLPPPYPGVTVVFRPPRAGAVAWINGSVLPDDLCATGDADLANRCLSRGARVLKPNGDFYGSDPRQGQRSGAAVIPAPTLAERLLFLQTLETLLPA